MRSLLMPGLMPFLDEIGLTQFQKEKLAAFACGVGMADERVAFATHLLKLNTSRPEARDRLMTRYGLSRRQAYRVISEAMDIRQNCAMKWHEPQF